MKNNISAPLTGFQRFMTLRVSKHECSHAFSGHFLGVPLDIVTIEKGNDSLARLSPIRQRSRECRSSVP
jgi:hypothetical protein